MAPKKYKDVVKKADGSPAGLKQTSSTRTSLPKLNTSNTSARTPSTAATKR